MKIIIKIFILKKVNIYIEKINKDILARWRSGHLPLLPSGHT